MAISFITSITMDMGDSFINAVKDHFPEADSLIAFDRFHVAQHFDRALDKVRAEEHRVLSSTWNYTYMGVAQKNWNQLLNWISHCQLKPIIAVGKTIRRFFWGILNAIRLREQQYAGSEKCPNTTY